MPDARNADFSKIVLKKKISWKKDTNLLSCLTQGYIEAHAAY